jgi:gluconolactonase
MIKYFLICFFLFCSLTYPQDEITFTDWELVVDNQNFPEGITFDGKANLYSSNCYGGWITKISKNNIDTFLVASETTFGKSNGLFALGDGSILATDYGNGSILIIDSEGNVEKLIPEFEGVPLNRPNDLTIDKFGNLFFTDPKSYGEDKLDGRIFYYNFDQDTLLLVQTELAFPNGIGISPIDGRLYVCESAKTRIISFTIDENGQLNDKKVFIDLPGGDPDGFNFDVEGNLYVAHFGGGNLFVISPDGAILKTVKTPGLKPTNVEFAGDDRKTLYLTEVETNSIFKCMVNVSGHSFF